MAEEKKNIKRLNALKCGSPDAVVMEGRCFLTNFNNEKAVNPVEVEGKVICSVSEGVCSVTYTNKKEHKMITFKFEDVMESLKEALEFNKEVMKYAGK